MKRGDDVTSTTKDKGDEKQPAEPEWPTHFPPHCPGARPDAKGTIYRFVKNNPPTQKDFTSHAENPNIAKDPANECSQAALSCCVDLETIQAIKRTVPYRRKQRIATAHLNREHGKLDQTGDDPSHYDLWLRTKFWKEAHLLFSVIPE